MVGGQGQQQTFSRELADEDYVALTCEPLVPASIEQRVLSPKAGAVVTFTGYTRDNFEGKQVTRLSYEAYAPLALNTLADIVAETRAQEPTIGKVAIVHLLGHSPVGTASLVISVSSKHRKPAFVATEHILEQVKLRCQVWKSEQYASGDAQWKENFPVAPLTRDDP